jgi:hypothetical protein
MKVKRTWNKFSKEWRCARVYERKSCYSVKLLTAEVLDAAQEPTQRKRPVSNLKLIILSRKSQKMCSVILYAKKNNLLVCCFNDKFNGITIMHLIDTGK